MVYLNRPYHFKFFKDCLPQILLGPFLNTLFQIFFPQFVLKNYSKVVTRLVFKKLMLNNKYMLKYRSMPS